VSGEIFPGNQPEIFLAMYGIGAISLHRLEGSSGMGLSYRHRQKIMPSFLLPCGIGVIPQAADYGRRQIMTTPGYAELPAARTHNRQRPGREAPGIRARRYKPELLREL
jgi:hypothetical protein